MPHTRSKMKLRGSGEEAYRALVGHTSECAGCRTGPCPEAVRLDREWKRVRS